MRRILLAVALVGIVVTASGCASFYRTPVMPPPGFVYNNTKAPMDNDYDNSQLGRQGTAQVKSVLGFVTWGDCSAATAARNGGITTIKHADYDFFNVLGVYSVFTTTVYGQ